MKRFLTLVPLALLFSSLFFLTPPLSSSHAAARTPITAHTHAATNDSNVSCPHYDSVKDDKGINTMDVWPCIDASSGNSVTIFGYASFRNILSDLTYTIDRRDYSIDSCTILVAIIGDDYNTGNGSTPVTQDCMGTAGKQRTGVALPGFTISSAYATLAPGHYHAEIQVLFHYRENHGSRSHTLDTTLDLTTSDVYLNWGQTCTQSNHVSFSTNANLGVNIDLWPCISISTPITTFSYNASFRNSPTQLNDGFASTLAWCQLSFISDGNTYTSDCLQAASDQRIGVLFSYNSFNYVSAGYKGYHEIKFQVALRYENDSFNTYLTSSQVTRGAYYG